MAILFDVEHLKSLVAIVDSGSFTRSAISMQMRGLEERSFRILEKEEGGPRLATAKLV